MEKGKSRKRDERISQQKEKQKKEQAMYAAWGTSSSDMYEKDDEDIALMAIEESNAKPKSDPK